MLTKRSILNIFLGVSTILAVSSAFADDPKPLAVLQSPDGNEIDVTSINGDILTFSLTAYEGTHVMAVESLIAILGKEKTNSLGACTINATASILTNKKYQIKIAQEGDCSEFAENVASDGVYTQN